MAKQGNETKVKTFRCFPYFFYWKFNASPPGKTSHFSVNFPHDFLPVFFERAQIEFWLCSAWRQVWFLLLSPPLSFSRAVGAIFGLLYRFNGTLLLCLGNCSIFLPQVASHTHTRAHTNIATAVLNCPCNHWLCMCVCVCTAVSLNGHLALSFGQAVNWSTGQAVKPVRGFFPHVFPLHACPVCRFYAKLVRPVMRWAIS